jgi:hypothetical protein
MRKFVSILIILFSICSIIYAHDNDVVHPDIITVPAVNLTTTTLDGYYEIGVYTRRNIDGNNNIREGSIDEDNETSLSGEICAGRRGTELR